MVQGQDTGAMSLADAVGATSRATTPLAEGDAAETSTPEGTTEPPPAPEAETQDAPTTTNEAAIEALLLLRDHGHAEPEAAEGEQQEHSSTHQEPPSTATEPDTTDMLDAPLEPVPDGVRDGVPDGVPEAETQEPSEWHAPTWSGGEPVASPDPPSQVGAEVEPPSQLAEGTEGLEGINDVPGQHDHPDEHSHEHPEKHQRQNQEAHEGQGDQDSKHAHDVDDGVDGAEQPPSKRARTE